VNNKSKRSLRSSRLSNCSLASRWQYVIYIYIQHAGVNLYLWERWRLRRLTP